MRSLLYLDDDVDDDWNINLISISILEMKMVSYIVVAEIHIDFSSIIYK